MSARARMHGVTVRCIRSLITKNLKAKTRAGPGAGFSFPAREARDGRDKYFRA